jgi:hypothetical protein
MARTVRSTRTDRVRGAIGQSDPRGTAAYGPPWLAFAAVVVAGWASHKLWGTTLPAAAIVPCGVLACTGILTGLTWAHSAAREPLLRWHATTATALAGGSIVVSCIAGVPLSLHAPWTVTLLFGGTVVALSWNVRRLDVVRGEGRDTHGRGDGNDLAAQLGLPGATFGKAKVDGPRAEIVVTTAGGQDYEDVQKAARKVASLAHLPPNSVRAVPDPDDASKARMIMVTEDVLRRQLPWPGPSHPGGTMADPIQPGLYEDGQPEQMWLAGNWHPQRPKDVQPRNATHLLIMGTSGAGKTMWALIIAVEILTRRHVALIWVDVVKGLQSARPIVEGVDALITDPRNAKSLLAGLKRAVAYRAQWLGEKGYREWWPGCGKPYVVVWIEEAPSVVADSSVITELSERMRSVGMSLVLSMQRASSDRLPPSTASNLGAAACFGVGDKGGFDDVKFALSEATIAAGARPEKWGATKPGYHYLETPGVPDDRWSMVARGFHEDDDPLRRIVTEYAGLREPVDDGTAECLGAEYLAARSASPSTPNPAPPERPTADSAGREPATQTGAAVDPYLDDDDGEDEWVLPPQPEPDTAARVDPRADLTPPAEEVDLTPPPDGRPALSREEKVTAFHQLLGDLMAGGQDEVRMADLVSLWERVVGQTQASQRPFLHALLNDLIELGQVERVEGGRGKYRLRMLVTTGNGHHA